MSGSFRDGRAVAEALAAATHPVTQAYLLPFAEGVPLPRIDVPIEPMVAEKLRQVAGASPLHLTLTEVVRRRYVTNRKAADRDDKQRAIAELAARKP